MDDRKHDNLRRTAKMLFGRVDTKLDKETGSEVLSTGVAPSALESLSMLCDVLSAITNAANSVGYSIEIYQAIADVIPKVTHFDSATLSVYEGKSRGFKLIAFSNVPQDFLEEVIENDGYIKSKELDEALSKSKEPLVFDDFPSDPMSSTPKASSGYQRMMIFPMQFSATSWGAMAFMSNNRAPWSEADVAWTMLIGRHCETLIRANRAVLDTQQMLMSQVEQYRSGLEADILDLLQRKPPVGGGDQLSRYDLTEREVDVLTLISMGKTNQEIADKLCVSLNTVKKHVCSVLKKLGLSNRTQAANLAKQFNLDTARFFR